MAERQPDDLPPAHEGEAGSAAEGSGRRARRSGKGMGRGLAAILAVSPKDESEERRSPSS